MTVGQAHREVSGPRARAPAHSFCTRRACLWVVHVCLCPHACILLPVWDLKGQVVCSFSRMKSFLKPVNNVKGKQRREVERPAGFPSLCWVGGAAWAPHIIREAQRQRGTGAAPPRAASCLFIFLSSGLHSRGNRLDSVELIVSKPGLYEPWKDFPFSSPSPLAVLGVEPKASCIQDKFLLLRHSGVFVGRYL